MSATIIAHKVTEDGFAVVVTEQTAQGFTASAQRYTANGGSLFLVVEQKFSSEAGAYEAFNKLINLQSEIDNEN